MRVSWHLALDGGGRGKWGREESKLHVSPGSYRSLFSAPVPVLDPLRAEKTTPLGQPATWNTATTRCWHLSSKLRLSSFPFHADFECKAHLSSPKMSRFTYVSEIYTSLDKKLITFIIFEFADIIFKIVSVLKRNVNHFHFIDSISPRSLAISTQPSTDSFLLSFFSEPRITRVNNEIYANVSWKVVLCISS